MKVWITDEPYPTSDEVLAEAQAAGAEQVLHGIPLTFEGLIPPGTLGLYDVVLPESPLWPALDSAGSLATLLDIEGVLTIEDAANAAHTVPEHLIAEAEAWSVATVPALP